MIDTLKIKLFCDGADLTAIRKMAAHHWVAGFTTNPTLMRVAGVTDYASFAREVLELIPDRPVSFEVFADDFDEMERQAMAIASWGANVNVKIPVTNTRREFAGPLIQRLSSAGVVVNVTAIFTEAQTAAVAQCLSPTTPAIVSVFAGRVADTGRDPVPVMRSCLKILEARPSAQLLWASPREPLNIYQADELGCHIITATPDMLGKLSLAGKDLDEFSLETVTMFYDAAQASGFSI